MWRLIYAIPIWLLVLLFRSLVILVGFFVVPVAVLAGAYVKRYDAGKAAKGENPIVYFFTWPWMLPWNNYEDGIANDTYLKLPFLWMQVLYWTCYRNPANGLRHTRLGLRIDPNQVEWVGTPKPAGSFDGKPPEPEWFFCWHGIRSNVWIQWRMFGLIWRFWIGDAKIFPRDRDGVSGHRAIYGAGIPTQLKRVK